MRNWDPSTADRSYSSITKCMSLSILLGLAGYMVMCFPKDNLLQRD